MGVPCLDEGSTPSSSTFKLLLKIKLLIIISQQFLFFIYLLYFVVFRSKFAKTMETKEKNIKTQYIT